MEHLSELVNEIKPSIEYEDLVELLPLLQHIQPKIIVEIGTWKGRSAKVFQEILHPELLISMDASPRFEDTVDSSLVNHILMYNTDSHSEETLERVKKLLNDRKIDFLFIDGDHTYEGVKKDWEMYGALVRQGGVIAFHDALYHADGTEEVDIFWTQLKWHYTHKEIMESSKSTGIGVIYL